jgi:drug/metabolite transporter (DMT)-like permease
MPANDLFSRVTPVLFVLIWSTGWVAAGYAAPYADALTFLTVRFTLATIALALLAVLAGARWPTGWTGWRHALIAGALMHGLYLSGVWVAVRMGLPAGISGLIAALQPLLTVAFSPWLIGERISARRWLGTALGFAGVGLVLAPKLVGVPPGALLAVAIPILINIAGMVAVTFGSFYQKRFLPAGDLRTMTAVQYLGALAITVPLMLAFEPMHIDWNLTVVLTMAWSVLGLSLGGIALFLLLIRRGEVSRAATLIYLVPPTVAVQAWVLFGEALSPVQIAGMVVTVAGVVLANRKERP